LDDKYAKWAQEDDSMSGVLNVKLTKIKNADFRLKLDAWRHRRQERKIQKKRRYEQMVLLREEFERYRQLFTTGSNQEKIAICIHDFSEFDEEFKHLYKEVKVINDFMCELPEGSHQILEMADLERLHNNLQKKFQ